MWGFADERFFLDGGDLRKLGGRGDVKMGGDGGGGGRRQGKVEQSGAEQCGLKDTMNR